MFMSVEVSNGTVMSNNSRLNFALINIFICSHFHHSCLAHVINLGNVDMMSHITKIAAVKNATVIWEYDPSLAGNRVLEGSLDVIAAICTLAIKVSNKVSLDTYSVLIISRFKHPDNVLNTSTAPNSVADFLRL